MNKGNIRLLLRSAAITISVALIVSLFFYSTTNLFRLMGSETAWTMGFFWYLAHPMTWIYGGVAALIFWGMDDEFVSSSTKGNNGD